MLDFLRSGASMLVHSSVVFFALLACMLLACSNVLRAQVNVSIQAMLTLYAQGLFTGVVVDTGDGVSHVVPVSTRIQILPTTLIEHRVPSKVRLLAFFFFLRHTIPYPTYTIPRTDAGVRRLRA